MEGGWAPEVLAKKLNGLAFLPQYRLASHPNSRFPAALQDAVTYYSYLLQLGIPASKTVFSGDSAGRNLGLGMFWMESVVDSQCWSGRGKRPSKQKH